MTSKRLNINTNFEEKIKSETSNTLAYTQKTKEGGFSYGVSEYLNTHVVHVTLAAHHLVKIIDKIKHDLHNRAHLHDMCSNLKFLTNGIQKLKSTIGTHTRILYDTLWSEISNISLVFNSTQLAIFKNSISNLN